MPHLKPLGGGKGRRGRGAGPSGFTGGAARGKAAVAAASGATLSGSSCRTSVVFSAELFSRSTTGTLFLFLPVTPSALTVGEVGIALGCLSITARLYCSKPSLSSSPLRPCSSLAAMGSIPDGRAGIFLTAGAPSVTWAEKKNNEAKQSQLRAAQVRHRDLLVQLLSSLSKERPPASINLAGTQLPNMEASLQRELNLLLRMILRSQKMKINKYSGEIPRQTLLQLTNKFQSVTSSSSPMEFPSQGSGSSSGKSCERLSATCFFGCTAASAHKTVCSLRLWPPQKPGDKPPSEKKLKHC